MSFQRTRSQTCGFFFRIEYSDSCIEIFIDMCVTSCMEMRIEYDSFVTDVYRNMYRYVHYVHEHVVYMLTWICV